MSRASSPQAGAEPTPAIRQYLKAKAEHPDAIIFFRMGDFYEMFFEDAVEAAPLLEITLTSRGQTRDGQKIPMAGVPFHAASTYIGRLLAAGKKIAICEQVEDPAKARGLVRREVVRVITPGLCLEEEALQGAAANYLALLRCEAELRILVCLELSTAEMRVCELASDEALLDELSRSEAREVLADAALKHLAEAFEERRGAGRLQWVEEDFFAFEEAELNTLAEDATCASLSPAAFRALQACRRYAARFYPQAAAQLRPVVVDEASERLGLDATAVRDLELLRSSSGETQASLLHLIDQSVTAMGSRLLRRWIVQPLRCVEAIEARLDAVDMLMHALQLRRELRALLAKVPDLERLTIRAVTGMATPRDLAAMRQGLNALHELLALLPPEVPAAFRSLASQLAQPDCQSLRALLCDTLATEPPVVVQGVGEGTIAPGVAEELDGLRRRSEEAKDRILELERKERERTGIASLQIGYTRVFGYYIEISRARLAKVPEDYRRKQTMAGAERFITPELRDLQDEVLEAEERAREVEGELFRGLRETVARYARVPLSLALAVAELDAYAGLAELAHRADFVRPRIDTSLRLELEGAWHPVVAAQNSSTPFVANDLRLDGDTRRLMVLTGPNMSGKSTYMRQTALAVILAQMGSFVPARKAHIGIVDRVFTRVGASDRLSEGKSTFMVEMLETAAILHHASARSLVILDEIGRGTSTYDGLSIAWSVASHLLQRKRARTIFATHYHELCGLPEQHPGAFNANVRAREEADRMVFFHQVSEGPCTRSYGIAVAKLAGLPAEVLEEAHRVLQGLESVAGGAPQPLSRAAAPESKVSAAVPREALLRSMLAALDLERLSPGEAWRILERLQILSRDESWAPAREKLARDARRDLS